MSTKLTKDAPKDVPEPLTVLLESATQSVLRSLSERLRACGFDDVTAPRLVLFGNLDCGATHAAQIAQRMGVSRQAISKTMREVQARGLVRLEDAPGQRNRKQVVMTARGMALATAARRELAAIEVELAARIGPEAATALRAALEKGWGGRTAS